MKIIKYPDGKSEKEYIKEKIFYKNMRCPFSEHDHRTTFEEYDWYEKEYVSSFLLVSTKKHLGVFRYKCLDCGSEWESEPYEI